MLRTPPWPAQATAPAALRRPEDTMTVSQREEQRAAEDAIIPSPTATPGHTAHVRDGVGVTASAAKIVSLS